MYAECFRKDCLNMLYLPKQRGEDQLDDLELDGPATLRILDKIAWDFIQSKMMDEMEDREVWQLNLKLLPPQPSRNNGQ